MGARIAMGVSYRGSAYRGWQSQLGGSTIQDAIEVALAAFAGVGEVASEGGRTLCAGRTDAGVHAVQQVIHFDVPVQRPLFSWVRGVNAHLPPDIAIQWCYPVNSDFHARSCAISREYVYVLRESPVRSSLEMGLVGWVFRPLNEDAMQEAAAAVLGEHDFSSFRSSQCQALSPIKTLMRLQISRSGSEKRMVSEGGAYWRFEFEANAFLHHMVRNLMGCLIAVGTGVRPPHWMADVLAARSRQQAAPTFSPDGLYFLGPVYPERWHLPRASLTSLWLPGA